MTTMIPPENDALETHLEAIWLPDDYGFFAKTLEPGALEFLARLAVAPGTRMLDVACGPGQIAIPAARTGVRVTGIDTAFNLIDQARVRARADGVDVRFDEGAVDRLPYEDGAFDMVVSLFGAMFAPAPERVAAELVRVCRSGGRIVMASWTSEGHVGQMFEIIDKYIPPPWLRASPLKWGDDATVRERLKDGIVELSTTKHLYPLRYPFPPGAVVEFFRDYFRPTHSAFSALDLARQWALRDDLAQLWTHNNRARDGSTHVEAEYLEVVAIRG
jgi:SAM-dependent methyltransferase